MINLSIGSVYKLENPTWEPRTIVVLSDESDTMMIIFVDGRVSAWGSVQSGAWLHPLHPSWKLVK